MMAQHSVLKKKDKECILTVKLILSSGTQKEKPTEFDGFETSVNMSKQL